MHHIWKVAISAGKAASSLGGPIVEGYTIALENKQGTKVTIVIPKKKFWSSGDVTQDQAETLGRLIQNLFNTSSGV
jgi:hypothetical protein